MPLKKNMSPFQSCQCHWITCLCSEEEMEERKVNNRAKPQLQIQQSQVLQNMSVCRGMAPFTQNMDHSTFVSTALVCKWLKPTLICALIYWRICNFESQSSCLVVSITPPGPVFCVSWSWVSHWWNPHVQLLMGWWTSEQIYKLYRW